MGIGQGGRIWSMKFGVQFRKVVHLLQCHKVARLSGASKKTPAFCVFDKKSSKKRLSSRFSNEMNLRSLVKINEMTDSSVNNLILFITN